MPEPLFPEKNNCITIKELRDWLNKCELDDNGEVWIGDAKGKSNPCVSIFPLNSSDIIFEITFI